MKMRTTPDPLVLYPSYPCDPWSKRIGFSHDDGRMQQRLAALAGLKRHARCRCIENPAAIVAGF
jgi:hypothetical protein